jgi:HipA-like protein
MSGVAKVGSANQRYVVPNEFICGRLGLMIGLPVPPGVVVRTDQDDLAYVALRFGKKGELPPPVIAEHAAQDNPAMTAGVIAFDCWMSNTDRHSGNLAYSRQGVDFAVFDHSHALLGANPATGQAYLAGRKDRPVVSSCLGPHVTTAKFFSRWTQRIGALPDDLIEDIVSTVTCKGGLTNDEAEAVVDFLRYRQSRVLSMLKQSRAEMPKASDWEPEQ